MFEVKVYFPAPVGPVDYRTDVRAGLDALAKGLRLPPDPRLPNDILTDDRLLIRVLEEIEETGTVTAEEWTQYRKRLPFIFGKTKLAEKYQGLPPADEERVEILALQAAFAAFRVIVWGDSLSVKDAGNPIVRATLDEMREYPAGYGRREDRIDKAVCWDVVARLVSDYEKWYSFRIVVREEAGIMETRAAASDLFTALLYQLLMHIQAGEAGLDGAGIFRCQGCGREFIRRNAKKRFCPECDGVSARAARSRRLKKEKERENNGQR